MKILDVPQSGSVAGVTSSRNRYGQYRRTRAIPVNPQSTRQVGIRNAFTQAAQWWGSVLTQQQRDGWDAMAATQPKTDALGQTYYLTGFQLFLSQNMTLYNATLAMNWIEDALPPPVGPEANITGATAGAGASTLSVTHDNITAGDHLLIEATPQMSPGVSYFGEFRRIACLHNTDASPTALGASYEAVFGDLLEGRNLKVRGRWISGGYVHQPVDVLVTVGA